MASRTFRSNGGRGPWLARVLRVENGAVVMERWRPGGRSAVKFRLPEWFLDSPSCGWAPAEMNTEATNG